MGISNISLRFSKNIDEMFDHVNKAQTNKSLLKKHLTKEMLESLKEKRTSKNSTLADCIIPGVMNLDSDSIGLRAADQESYTVFSILFDPVIKEYHNLKADETISHPAVDFGDFENLGFDNLDPDGEMIESTRIRVGRSHKDFPFPPVLTREERLTMELMTVEALNSLDGELKGEYHPLTGMTSEVQQQLIADHFLFSCNNRLEKSVGVYNDWPTGRGIFFNESKNFLVWVNEEDHLRIISMQKGADLGAVYKRLVKAIQAIDGKLTFARNEKLGYLAFCPTNLGTTLRASVHLKIPHLSARKDFMEILADNKLQARGVHGHATESEESVFDISNKVRLGLSEIEAVKEMAAGVKELIRLEKKAAWNETKLC